MSYALPFYFIYYLISCRHNQSVIPAASINFLLHSPQTGLQKERGLSWDTINLYTFIYIF
jgi:hypothetical protein